MYAWIRACLLNKLVYNIFHVNPMITILWNLLIFQNHFFLLKVLYFLGFWFVEANCFVQFSYPVAFSPFLFIHLYFILFTIYLFIIIYTNLLSLLLLLYILMYYFYLFIIIYTIIIIYTNVIFLFIHYYFHHYYYYLY